jgi:FKBP-type peptidyl-prolyl cis-trans isomerase FklB
MGYNIGGAWKRQGIEPNDVNLDALMRGLRDATAERESLVPEAESRQLLDAYQTELRTRREEKRKQQAETNQLEGEKFRAEYQKKAGVQTLPSGLMYRVITEGSGPKPSTNDTVKVNYRGTLIDGTEFDSSYKRGQPATFRTTGVIRGWTEALLLMGVGSKWELVIPPDLAYGERGAGANIGPSATLIFEVELLSIEPAAPAPASIQQQPVTSDIIKVPSAEELKRGAKIEIIKPDQVEKELQKQSERKN